MYNMYLMYTMCEVQYLISVGFSVGLLVLWVFMQNGRVLMVYVDAIRYYPLCRLSSKRWCHMATDGDIEELHQMAQRLGLRRAWFQAGRLPHYDLTPSKRRLAVRFGAQEREAKELLRCCYPWVRVLWGE
jgi:Protein of unknown function (DUF4031)